jgi:hypothetical protein
MGASNLPFFATASREAAESNSRGRHGQQGVGGDLLAVATSASSPGRCGRPMDSSGDRRSGGSCIDGFGSAEVAAGLRGGAGERLLPVHPIRPLHTLPLLGEGPPILSSFGWSASIQYWCFLCRKKIDLGY